MVLQHFLILGRFDFEFFFRINSTMFIRPRPFHFGIVDEVDFILIDEGRNPLLISGEVYFLVYFVVLFEMNEC